MTRRVAHIVLALIGILASSSVGATDIRVGFANPLSGPYAESGQRNRAVAELAVADLNARGGVLRQPVALVAVDDACSAEQAAVAAQQLVDTGVGFVVGHMCSHASLIAAGVYEAAGILMLSADSTHPRLTEEGRRNVFRLIGRDDRQGRMAGDFLVDRWPGGRIAIVHDGSTYGQGLAAQTRFRLRERGVVEALYAYYEPGLDDPAELADRLQAAGIDVLYVGGYGPDAARIVRAVRQRGSRLQLVGGDGLGMREFWEVAGAAGEGAIFTDRRNVTAAPEAAAVLAEFRALGFGTLPSGIGTYAAVQVWAQAVSRAGTTESAAVAKALHAGRFDTVLGRVAFDDKGDLDGADWQWQVWRDGGYAPLPVTLARR